MRLLVQHVDMTVLHSAAEAAVIARGVFDVVRAHDNAYQLLPDEYSRSHSIDRDSVCAAFKHALTARDQYILCSEYRRVHGVLGLPLGTGPALRLPFNEVAA